MENRIGNSQIQFWLKATLNLVLCILLLCFDTCISFVHILFNLMYQFLMGFFHGEVAISLKHYVFLFACHTAHSTHTHTAYSLFLLYFFFLFAEREQCPPFNFYMHIIHRN